MDKIYVVTSGSYSSYCICAIFSNEVIANKYLTDSDIFEGSIEEYYLDVLPENWTVTTVRMTKEGTVIETYQNYPNVDSTGRSIFDVNNNLVCDIRTNDVKKAIKSTNEIRSKAIALKLWGKDWLDTNPKP